MKSVITVTQIDGATVQVNPQNIEAIIEVLPDSSTAYMYPKATFLIHMISGLLFQLLKLNQNLKNY